MSDSELEATPTLNIELNIECPYCGEYFDLFDISHLTDDGHLYKQAIPGDEVWSEAHERFEEEINCPECRKLFIAKGIHW